MNRETRRRHPARSRGAARDQGREPVPGAGLRQRRTRPRRARRGAPGAASTGHARRDPGHRTRPRRRHRRDRPDRQAPACTRTCAPRSRPACSISSGSAAWARRRSARLREELGVASLADLERACREGRVAGAGRLRREEPGEDPRRPCAPPGVRPAPPGLGGAPGGGSPARLPARSSGSEACRDRRQPAPPARDDRRPRFRRRGRRGRSRRRRRGTSSRAPGVDRVLGSGDDQGLDRARRRFPGRPAHGRGGGVRLARSITSPAARSTTC